MDKMTIEKAREVLEIKYPSKYWNRYSLEQVATIHSEAKGFIDGYESREAEVEDLKKKLQRVQEDINWMMNNQRLLNPDVFEYLWESK